MSAARAAPGPGRQTRPHLEASRSNKTARLHLPAPSSAESGNDDPRNGLALTPDVRHLERHRRNRSVG